MLLLTLAQTTLRPSRWTSPAHPHRWSLQQQRFRHTVLQRRNVRFFKIGARVLMSQTTSHMMCQRNPTNPVPAMVTRLHQLGRMMKRKRNSLRLMRSPHTAFKMMSMIWVAFYLWPILCKQLDLYILVLSISLAAKGNSGIALGLFMIDPMVKEYIITKMIIKTNHLHK